MVKYAAFHKEEIIPDKGWKKFSFDLIVIKMDEPVIFLTIN